MGGERWSKSTFTIFDVDWNPKDSINFDECHFVVCQKEITPSTKRLHWQGYIEIKNRKGNKGFKDILNCKTAHIERACGNAAENEKYCTKLDTKVVDENSFFFGKPCVAGQRSDLSALQTDLQSGMSMLELSDAHFGPFLHYSRSIREYKLLHTPPRKWLTELHIVTGKSGIGKSRNAWNDYPDAYPLRKCNTGTLWWDGYENHETVIIDDFYGWMPFDTLLRIADRYPMLVDTKGGAVQFTAKRIIITSNDIPKDWYPNVSCIPKRWNALLRRITSHNHNMVVMEHVA